MSKLSSIFHNNIKYNANNKSTFNTFDKEEKKVINSNSFNQDSLINYFNKRITVILSSKKEIEGTLLSKRNNYILLDTGDYIDIKDILSIK